MKKLFLLCVATSGLSLQAFTFNADYNTGYYTYDSYQDTNGCGKTYTITANYKGGTIKYGCDTTGFDETYSKYYNTTTQDYAGRAYSAGYAELGPRIKSGSEWSKGDVKYRIGTQKAQAYFW